jgi:hypothetical protein
MLTVWEKIALPVPIIINNKRANRVFIKEFLCSNLLKLFKLPTNSF